MHARHGLGQKQDTCGPEKPQSYHGVYSVVKHSVRCQTPFSVFYSQVITQPFSILPAVSSIQERWVGAMMEGRISVSLHLSLKSNVLFISVQDPTSLHTQKICMHFGVGRSQMVRFKIPYLKLSKLFLHFFKATSIFSLFSWHRSRSNHSSYSESSSNID